MERMRNRLVAGGLSVFLLMNALPLQTAQTAFAAEIAAEIAAISTATEKQTMPIWRS